jgi:hypothetical protein
MFGFLRRWVELRREAEREADDLIVKHGQDAWSVIYGMCRERAIDENERRFRYRVRAIIERKLKIAPHVDTATRYLEKD